jgi:hypothetical protein
LASNGGTANSNKQYSAKGVLSRIDTAATALMATSAYIQKSLETKAITVTASHVFRRRE